MRATSPTRVFLAFLAVTSTVACSSNGDDTPGKQAVAVCQSSCDVVKPKAKNCPANAADNCKQFCAFWSYAPNQDCVDKLKAMYACQEGLSWECLTGGELWVSSDASKCQALSDAAYTACGVKCTAGCPDTGTDSAMRD